MMPKAKRYFVEPSNGDWVLTSSKGKTIRRFLTKRQAIEAGATRANAAKGQLVIKKSDGTIQSERTYGRDPYPPAG
jgi:hypothetical protein